MLRCSPCRFPDNDKSSPLRNIHHLLFDLDGTLVDSSVAIRSSLAYALDCLGSSLPSELAVETLIGTPLVDIFRDQFGIIGSHAERAIALYRRHFDQTAAAETRVYDHMFETLDRLRAAGFNLFVATVKPSPIARKVLRDMRLDHYFSGVAGGSMDHARRKKADIIQYVLRQNGLDPNRSLMIGDRAQDISGARHNGLQAIGVTYGFGLLEELTMARADHLVRCPREIPRLLLENRGLGG